jgi:GNAT superfamily N-acetyltransferase
LRDADPDPLAAYALTYAALMRATPGCRVADIGRAGSLLCTVTPFPFASYNRVMNVRLTDGEVDQAIEAVKAAHGTTGVPGSWWLESRSTPAGLPDALRRAGYVAEDTAPAMAVQIGELPAVVLPPGVELFFVRGHEEMLAAQLVIATGFGRPPDLGREMAEVIAPLGDEPDSPIRVVVATLNGELVATATAITSDGVCGVFMVATLPEARGKGLGRATTLAVLHDARERGAHTGVLHASELGFSVYLRMGFRHVGDYRRFSSR